MFSRLSVLPLFRLLGLDTIGGSEGFRHNRGNFKERDFFLQKCFDRHFIGSVQYGRACPSLNEGLARNPYGWEAFLIRRFKIQSANRNEIKRRAGRCDPFRPGKGMGNRNAHVWRAKLSQGGVIAKFHQRSEEHTSELQSLMRISYAVFCLKKKKNKTKNERMHN